MTNMTTNPWDQSSPGATSLTPEQGVRMFFGAALLIFGMVVAGVVVYQAKQVLFGPAEPVVLKRLTPSSLDDVTMIIGQGPTTAASATQQSQRIQIPGKTLTLIGYFLTMLLLWVAGKIAYLTVSSGTRLLLMNREQPSAATDP